MDRPSLNEPYLPRPDDSLASLLQRYRSQRVGRAGGVYALTGFDFQLRTYLADYVMELANPEKLAVAGAEFSSALESFSDYTRRSAADVVCVQVKTTLGRRELRTALREFVDIAEFLREESSWIPKFEIVAQHIETNIDLVKLCAGDMSAVEALSADERATEILVTGRLLAIRLEPDPWWRLISACYGQLDDPFAFARWALDKCMGIDSSPGTAAEIRDSIAEEFVRRRKQTVFPGSVITDADVMIDAAGSDDFEIGPAGERLHRGTEASGGRVPGEVNGDDHRDAQGH